MKTLVIYSLLLSFSFGIPAFAADVDLDQAFLKATGSRISNPLRAELPRGWDGSGAFPPIVRQSPFGACQTFSMTAMMEYLFYRETGKTLKLSEKQMAHSLLTLMIKDFWDPEKKSYENKPGLGLGVAGPMIETVTRAGLLPNADYPWGEFESADGSRSIDVALFDKVFEKPEKDYTPEEYSRLLNEAFLSPPPAAFRYAFKTLNFATGKEEELVVKNPAELSKVAGFSKERFLVLHNATPNLTYSPQKPEETKEMLKYFESQSTRYGIRNQSVPGEEIMKQIVSSLNNRMVVLIALDVWSGSWTDKLVYAGGGGHGVVITGYQLRDGELYFKIRNSWGPNMGLGGYNLVKAAHIVPNLYYAILFQ